MQQTISIEALKPGMYVLAVSKQKAEVKLSSKGWVKTEAMITSLKNKGILEVIIDPDKSLFDEIKIDGETVDNPTNNENQLANRPNPKRQTTSVEAELNKANKLYNEAQNLQKKIFIDIKEGKKINLAPVKETTSALIDSIFRNQDALTCLTRIREKDAYLFEHSLNVSILMSMFAKHLKLAENVIQELATGAFLHDIGKILIPNEILHKTGSLTASEFEIMKTHVEHSMRILKETPGISDIAYEVAAQHHEKLSGKGYPAGLANDEISQWGRMITIVDIYDALTAQRIYKKAMTPSGAFKLMMTMATQDLDHRLLQQFIQCLGIHPVGTLVKLTSGKLGIITKSNAEQPLKPIVKLFYHAKYDHYTDIKDIDLAKANCKEVIETSVKPEQFKIELNKFMREVLLN